MRSLRTDLGVSAAWTVSDWELLRDQDSYSYISKTFGTFFIKNSWAWRIPSAIQGLPALLQLFLIWFVPESPRWLISKGREAEARRMLGYWHGNGDEYAFKFTLYSDPCSLGLKDNIPSLNSKLMK